MNKKPKLLYIDDNNDSREYFAQLIDKQKYEIIEFSNPVKLLQAVDLMPLEDELIILADNCLPVDADCGISQDILRKKTAFNTETSEPYQQTYVYFYDFLNNCNSVKLKNTPWVSLTGDPEQEDEMLYGDQIRPFWRLDKDHIAELRKSSHSKSSKVLNNVLGLALQRSIENISRDMEIRQKIVAYHHPNVVFYPHENRLEISGIGYCLGNHFSTRILSWLLCSKGYGGSREDFVKNIQSENISDKKNKFNEKMKGLGIENHIELDYKKEFYLKVEGEVFWSPGINLNKAS